LSSKIVIPFIYDWAEPMDGKAIVKNQGKFGLLKEDGQLSIPCLYDQLKKDKMELYLATKDGKTVKLFENGILDNELIPTEEDNKYTYVTRDGSEKIGVSFDDARAFTNGLAPVKSGGKWGFIIPTGFMVIQNQFDDVRQFNSEMVAPVKLNGKWGIIDYTGKFVCEPQFDSIVNIFESPIRLINKQGVYEFGSEGNLKLLSINSEKGSFTDSRDGRTYKSVKIGNQIWMAQNLDYKTDESFYYDNNESNAASYGRLYTWKAALSACPTGWHLPSDEDWKILEKNLGMPEEEVNSTDYSRGKTQAPNFKVGGSSGLDIQMSGFLHGYDNNFYKLGSVCIIWSSTPNGNEFAWSRSFDPEGDLINRNNNTYVKYALPVRCVKD